MPTPQAASIPTARSPPRGCPARRLRTAAGPRGRLRAPAWCFGHVGRPDDLRSREQAFKGQGTT